MTKTCTRCGIAKLVDEFHKDASKRDGRRPDCKVCVKVVAASYYQANIDRILESSSKYYFNNRDKVLLRTAGWQAANQERARAAAAKWQADNRYKVQAASAKRRASLKRAIPRWANLADIQRFYACAAKVTKQTGVMAHVDHIVPLQSDYVCGLHWAVNLTIMTDAYNKRKGNRWWPDMPERTE